MDMSSSIRTLIAVGLLTAAPPEQAVAQADGTPTLVVMIVVDQLGGGLLDRYEPALTGGGFRRFMDEGRRYTQASHAHAMPETAPGHATLATGVFPARHGIVSNSWHQRAGFDWPLMYAVGDSASRILGHERDAELEGRSPANLLRDGLADWVLAADPRARAVSISKKDRSAVAMAGRSGASAWWLLDAEAVFVTSTHYADRYPTWLSVFNREVMPGIAASPVWLSEVPAELRGLAEDDAQSYEVGGRDRSSFPHRGADEAGPPGSAEFNVWAFDTPRADDAVLELAKTAITQLQLGQRGSVDFLAVSFSALDRVGHRYGPVSQEALSTLVHLDLVLANLLADLDEQVGRGRWIAGLAGDHGVALPPEAARAHGNDEAERIMDEELLADMGQSLRRAAANGGRPEVIAERLADLIEEEGLVEAAYTHHQLTLGGEPADSFSVLFRNSYYPGRAWGVLSRYGVEVRYGEGDLVTSFTTGTDHGSPYWYDRHVEMMMLGPGVMPGISDEPVYTVDFAPTLAGLAAIRFPEDLDGRRLF
ncbi:MAG: alkaline phosphatase family protein [Gemmatimonadales bacterium]